MIVELGKCNWLKYCIRLDSSSLTEGISMFVRWSQWEEREPEEFSSRVSWSPVYRNIGSPCSVLQAYLGVLDRIRNGGAVVLFTEHLEARTPEGRSRDGEKILGSIRIRRSMEIQERSIPCISSWKCNYFFFFLSSNQCRSGYNHLATRYTK